MDVSGERFRLFGAFAPRFDRFERSREGGISRVSWLGWQNVMEPSILHKNPKTPKAREVTPFSNFVSASFTGGKPDDLFIHTLDLPPDEKARLLQLTPETYTGLAAKLVNYIIDPATKPAN